MLKRFLTVDTFLVYPIFIFSKFSDIAVIGGLHSDEFDNWDGNALDDVEVISILKDSMSRINLSIP